MHRFFRTALAAAVVALLSPNVARAAPELNFGGTATFTAADRADITRIEKYLNDVKTMRSKFIQVAPDGRQATGMLHLSRPGKMRLTYDPPFKDFIVADGLFIFYWDAEMRQQSSAPLGSSLADVILRKDLRLSGDVTVKALSRLPGALEVTLTETKDAGKGSIALIFQDMPLSLIRWRVRDAQGLTTEVGLIDPVFGVKLDPELFTFREPKEAKESDGFSRN